MGSASQQVEVLSRRRHSLIWMYFTEVRRADVMRSKFVISTNAARA